MSPLSRQRLLVPIFAGQGSTPSTHSSYINSTIRRSQHGLCATLLTICHEAFIDELSSLSAQELTQAGVDPNDFRSPETLLTMWMSRFPHNALISSSALVLMQLLQYLSFVEQFGAENGSLRPFADLLIGHSTSSVGILGFSSGIVSACVVASSNSAKSYLSFALEAYRLALWIGIRCQLYCFGTSDADTVLPWSVVFIRISTEEAQEAISDFESRRNSSESEDPSKLYITAVMDDHCVTVSGCPPILAEFTASVCRTLPSVLAHQTTVDTLYHSPVHLRKVRDQVLVDVADRNIRFPELSHLHALVRSTSTGVLLSPSVESDRPLVQMVVDMLIIEPVRWDLVTDQVSRSIPEAEVVVLNNFGPGIGVARTLEKICSPGRVQLRDLCSEFHETRSQQEPIAIVGMAVNMPGSSNISKLWEVLEKGLNTLDEIPEHRFSIRDYEGTKNPNRQMKARTGNFIQGADEFDNRFFKISPREAKSMDPQQRVLLHTAYKALEDSGYVPGTTSSSQADTFGCYIGAATHDYVQNLRGDIDVYYSTGTLCSYLSGRISYTMGWSGPSMVVDTACSSSLAAVYQGARALMNGDCKSALVGGVNVITSPDMFLGLDRGHFLSPTGQCRAFDAAADGYSRGEGCGLFVLKRLSDALAENDNIYGTIRGIEVNQSGLAHSITHPHAPTQVALFERVLRNAAIHPSRVNVVEAHGTGTQAGDINEIASIRQVFAANRTVQNPLHVTSIKGNIGHLEAASGAAGLAKLLLMLKHQTIPPQISFDKLNPSIEPLENDNTKILRRSSPWKPSYNGSSRMAFLNNFGASGSNVALVLEEHIHNPSQAFDHPLVFVLSAKDEHALHKLRFDYIQWLQSPESKALPLVDIAYTMTARRQLYSYRLAVVVSERTRLVESLHKAAIVSSSAQPPRRVVFVFSGQSSEYPGMGQDSYSTSPLFKHHVDECHAILISLGFHGVLSIFTGNEDVLSDSEKIEAYQAAIFTLEYALGKLWMFWGIIPTAVIGHSLGEYTALVFAGVLTLRGALTLIAHRVRLMSRKCDLDLTGMLAINLSPDLVKHLLGTSENVFPLTVSCYNGPNDCVVSGPLKALEDFKSFLDATKGCRSKMLAVPYGYHSDFMLTISSELTSIAKGIEIRAPNLPVASNVDGNVVLPGEEGIFKPDYFARHCSQPVQFDGAVRALTDAFELSGDVWLEIGPHPTCLPMLKGHSSLSSNALLISSFKRNQDSWLTLGSALCSLLAADIPIQWRNTFSHLPHTRCISLPSYPFATSKYWAPYEEDRLVVSSRQPSLTSGYTFLHNWEQYPSSENGHVAIFETPISQLSDLILGHKVGGLPLCPASIFIELVLSAVELSIRRRDVSSNESLVQITSSRFLKGLVFKENIPRILVIEITLGDGQGSFAISSRVEPSNELILHVRGDYLLQSISDCAAKLCQMLPSVTGCINRLKDPSTRAEVFLSRTTYEVVFPRVVHYAKEYHTIKSLFVSPTDLQGCASICLPSGHYRGTFTAHPVFLDTLLQVPGFIANLQGKRQPAESSDANLGIHVGDVFICSEITSCSISTTSLDDNATYSIYCAGVWLDNRTLSFDVYAVKDGDSLQIIASVKGVVFRQMALETLRKALSLAAMLGQPQGSQSLPALSNPPLQSRARSHSSPPNFVNVVGELHSRIFDAIAETCGVTREQITASSALDSLGIDSLMLIELSTKLQSLSSKIDLELQSLYSCKTVADIIRKSCSVLGLGNAPVLTIAPPSLTCVESEPSSPSTLVADDRLSDTVFSRADVYLDVRNVINAALGTTEAFGDETDLEAVGLDSLASIEILHALQTHYGRQVPNDFLRKYRTISAIQEYLGSSKFDLPHRRLFIPQSPPKEAVQARLIGILRLGTNPVRVQDCNKMNTPIFFIHDGSGLVNYYDKVESLHRDVWAIYNPKFLFALPWGSLKDMALAYADYISALSTGPILLGGWSFGGVVAYEVALQLAKRGVTTKGIILIDAPNPIGHVPLSDALIKTIARYDRKNGPVEIGKLVRTQFAMNAQLLSAYDPHETGGVCPPLVFLRSELGYAAEGIQVADIPSWLVDRSDPSTTIAGWSELSSSVKVWDVPGHHFQAFDNANIASVSAKLLQACEYLETL